MSSLPEKIIYVNKNAAKGGDGSAARPFACLEAGFRAAKVILAESTAQNVVLSLSAGHYALKNTLTLSGDEMNPASRLTLRGTVGTVISSLQKIKAEAFSPTETPNLYTAKLVEPDGTPTRYRYLYVDGKRARLAASGGTKVEDPTIRRQRFERTFDAKGREDADVKAECKMYLDRALLAPIIGDKTEGIIPVTEREFKAAANLIFMTLH